MVLIFSLFSIESINTQNLLNTSSWTVGSGSVSGFGQNGSTTENIREYGTNHIGENIILWKAVPDATRGPDGGWNSSYLTIDNTKKYRFSVWIKKTNSEDGNTYFGCQQWQPDTSFKTYTILNINNSVNRNPYFYSGKDLPILDRWYLLVGFIHGKNATVSSNEGALYDGLTGNLVQSLTDFKFNSTTTKIRHRTYLYYVTNTLGRQYMYAPRIELANGEENTIDQLLSLNPGSSLTFTFDNSGNQKQRFYCPDSCSSEPTPPAGKASKDKNSIAEENKTETEELIDLDSQLSIYPNPSKDIVYIKLNPELLAKTESIKIYNVNSSLVQTLEINNANQNLKIDLSDKQTGAYFLHIHMNDGSKSITKKIIKN